MRKKLKPASAPVFSKLFIPFLLFFSVTTYSQTISGIVSNVNNQPIAGVTVQVKNTPRATVTNNEGRFQIRASGKDVLVFSYVGFTKQEVPVIGKSSLTIKLAEGAGNKLDEVVVTALGIRRAAKSLGYAINSVKNYKCW
jgi:hypothetical protein